MIYRGTIRHPERAHSNVSDCRTKNISFLITRRDPDANHSPMDLLCAMKVGRRLHNDHTADSSTTSSARRRWSCVSANEPILPSDRRRLNTIVDRKPRAASVCPPIHQRIASPTRGFQRKPVETVVNSASTRGSFSTRRRWEGSFWKNLFDMRRTVNDKRRTCVKFEFFLYLGSI